MRVRFAAACFFNSRLRFTQAVPSPRDGQGRGRRDVGAPLEYGTKADFLLPPALHRGPFAKGWGGAGRDEQTVPLQLNEATKAKGPTGQPGSRSGCSGVSIPRELPRRGAGPDTTIRES